MKSAAYIIRSTIDCKRECIILFMQAFGTFGWMQLFFSIKC